MLIPENNPFALLSEYELTHLAEHSTYHLTDNPNYAPELNADYAYELHELLFEETDEQNAYLEALEAINCADKFLENINKAWEDAEKEYEVGCYLSQSSAISLQFRYALITTSFNTIARDFPNEFLGLLAKTKRWSATQCMSYISRKGKYREEEQLSILADVAQYYPDELLPQAITLAEEIKDESKVWNINRLFSHFPDNSKLFELSLETSQALTDLKERVKALMEIGKIIEDNNDSNTLLQLFELGSVTSEQSMNYDGLLTRFIEIEKKIKDNNSFIYKALLEACREIQDESDRVQALIEIAEFAQDKSEILAQILEILLEFQDQSDCILGIEKIIDYLDDSQFIKVLEYTLALSSNMSDEEAQEKGLIKEKFKLLSKLLRIVCVSGHKRKGDEALPYFYHVIALSNMMPDLQSKVDALIDFGPYLPRELVPEFLEATKDLNEEHGTLILASIAQHIPSEKLTDLVYLLTCLPWNGGERLGQILKLISRIITLPNISREILSNLLDGISNINNEFSIIYFLEEIAPLLPDELLPKTLEIANQTDLIQSLIYPKLAKHFPQMLPETIDFFIKRNNESSSVKSLVELAIAYPNNRDLLEQTLYFVRLLKEKPEKVESLIDLAIKFPEIMPEALATAQTLKNHTDRDESLRKLIPHLPDHLLSKALKTAKAINEDRIDFFTSIKELATYVPNLMVETIPILQKIDEKDEKEEAIVQLIPYLSKSLFPTILVEIKNIEEEYYQKNILLKIISSLDKNLLKEYLSEILEIIRSINSLEFKAELLRKISCYAPEIWSEAADIAYGIENKSKKVKVLSLFISLSPSLREDALNIARTIEDNFERGKALIKLIPPRFRPLDYEEHANYLHEIMDIITKHIRDGYSKVVLLNQLIPCLPSSLKKTALSQALSLNLSMPSNYFRGDIELSHLVPNLSDEFFEELLEHLENNPQKVGLLLSPTITEYVPEHLMLRALAIVAKNTIGGNVFEKIAPRLPDKFKSETIDLTTSIKSISFRSDALQELVPYLPDKLLPKILDATKDIGEESEQDKAELLSTLAPRLIQLFPDLSYRIWLKILRPLASINRRFLLDQMDNLSFIIHQLGGKEAVAEAIDTIQTVQRYWP